MGLVLGWALLLGCGDPTSTWYVAVGSQDTLPRHMGPCSHGATLGPLRFTGSGDGYEVVSAGRARLECRDGTMVFEAREPARLVVSPVPTAEVGARVVYGVTAVDVGGVALDLGRDTPVQWTFSGALTERSRPGCGDVIPVCPARSAGYARAGAAGTGSAEARLGALGGSTTTVVR